MNKEPLGTAVKSFRSFDGSTIVVMSDGRMVRHSITGRMLLTSRGRFVRYLTTDEVVASAWRAVAP